MKFNLRQPNFQQQKTNILEWNSFRGGLNTFLKNTEIKDNELAKANNLKLVGQGVPTKREGTDNYFLAGTSVATGAQGVRGLKGVLFASGASGVNELLAISDTGFLVKKSGVTNTIVTGFSYASGYPAEMVQSFNKIYIVNGFNVLTKYDGNTIASFTQLSRPTGVTATNLSGVSGTLTRSFRISAFNAVGETLASDTLLVSNMPQSPTMTTVRLQWTTASPASLVTGYGIYGYDQGDERLITTVDPSTLRYDYSGVPEPSVLVTTPLADSTGGPVAKFMIGYKDRVVLGNISSFPSRVMWSGGGVNIEKFNWRYGGGYIDIDKDSGDQITGLIEFQDQVIVFKERSVWTLTFTVDDTGLTIPSVKLLIRGIGTVSHRTIKAVENDVFFLSRRGVYTLGNEANYLTNTLRTNELSAKIRPIFETLSPAQVGKTCAIYKDNKYRLSYPDTGSSVNSKEIIYDRERLAWMGPNNYPATASVYEVYYDGGGVERLVWGDSNDNYVTDFSSVYETDKGVRIPISLLTKKSYFNNPFNFKFIRNIFSEWRHLAGSPNVNVVIEGRSGVAANALSFSFTAPEGGAGVGWGFNNWGSIPWGNTYGAGTAISNDDILRRNVINLPSRSIQLEVYTEGATDKFELLGFRIEGQPLQGLIPSTWDE